MFFRHFQPRSSKLRDTTLRDSLENPYQSKCNVYITPTINGRNYLRRSHFLKEMMGVTEGRVKVPCPSLPETWRLLWGQNPLQSRRRKRYHESQVQGTVRRRI